MLLFICAASLPQAPLLPGLLGALARKLAAAEDSALVQSLITVLAQLAQLDVGQLVSILAGINQPDGRSALAAVMDKWVDRQIEIRTAYDIKLTTTALAALVGCGHPALAALQAKGRRLDIASGIRTRARARQQVSLGSPCLLALPVKRRCLGLTESSAHAWTCPSGLAAGGAVDDGASASEAGHAADGRLL